MGPLEKNENIQKFEILREVQNGLQRLAERIERLAERLDRLSEPDAAKESSERGAAKAPSVFLFGSSRPVAARSDDLGDRRRAFVALTDRAAEAMARYFAEAERRAAELA